jgi:hypothetical protein
MEMDTLQSVKARLDYEYRLLNTKLSDGISILELTEYEGVSLWWFVDSGFNEIVKTYHWGQKSHDKENKDAFGINKYIRALAWISSLGNGIFLRYGARSIARPGSLFTSRARGGCQVILITGEDIEWRRMFDPETGKEITTDQFFKPILDIASEEKNRQFISTYPLKPPLLWALPSFFQSVEIAKEKKENWGVTHIPFEAFSSMKADLTRIKAWIHFSKVWKRIEHDPVFLEVHKSADVGDVSRLIERFRKYFKYDLPEAAWRVAIARQCVQELSPDLIILEEEYGRFERGLTIAAREMGRPTLGIQHGIIHEDHKGYILRKGEIAIDGSIKAPFSQVPDITAVYGERYRRLLVEDSAYPPDTVQVTGQPRYDRIARIMVKMDPFEIQRSIPVPSGKKMVLMAMAFNGLPDDENELYLKIILQAIKEIPDSFLVIKQHPGETDNHKAMILEMIANAKDQAILVPKASDTLRLIWASDLVLTRYSTTGLEAIAFGKPLIVMNLSGQPDTVDYASEGVAKGVYAPSDLRPSIERLLTADDENIVRNRERYILDNLYRMDGNSAMRVNQLIERLLARMS